MSLNAGTTLGLSVFLPYVTRVQMKFTCECMMYIEFIFPSSSPKSGYALKPFISILEDFWKLKKKQCLF